MRHGWLDQARGAADVLSSLFVQQPSGYDVTVKAYRIDGGRIVENRDYAMSTHIVCIHNANNVLPGNGWVSLASPSVHRSIALQLSRTGWMRTVSESVQAERRWRLSDRRSAHPSRALDTHTPSRTHHHRRQRTVCVELYKLAICARARLL